MRQGVVRMIKTKFKQKRWMKVEYSFPLTIKTRNSYKHSQKKENK